MSNMKVVVLGASGFVGTTLVERLLEKPELEVVPVIHSAGSAWRLARRPGLLTQVDIEDKAALSKVLRGATHVVNCTRGPRAVMISGLQNILDACRSEGVARFVHLSSVLVYGDPPRPEASDELAPPNPQPGKDSYGFIKFEQDQLVEAAARSGLSSVVLCPPNISGPFSGYLVGILNGLRTGTFALMDDGASPCNLVDVRNLCHAIELAMMMQPGNIDATRMFITDGGNITWKDVVYELHELVKPSEPRRIERAVLEKLVRDASATPRASLGRSLRHLVSSDVRAALRKDPLLCRLDQAARGLVANIGGKFESSLRQGIEGPLAVTRPNPYADLTIGLCAQQLRGVRHSSSRAQRVLGFEPPITFARSMADFRTWYRVMHGMDQSTWELSRHLYVPV